MSNNSYLEEPSTESVPQEIPNGRIIDEVAKEVTDDELIEKQKLILKLKETEDEIETLRQVLGSKIRLAHHLRRTIGITPMDEIKDDINYGLKLITSSDKFKSTSTILQNAKLKTQSTLNTAGSKISEKWGAVRQTDRYKQWSSKVGQVQESIKKHLTPPTITGQTVPEPVEVETPNKPQTEAPTETPVVTPENN